MTHGQASMFSVGGGETKYRFESARALPASSDEWLNGAVRVISDCHFSVRLNHFIPVFLSYSVAVFLK
jgi:hypothetical protein